MIIIMYSVTSQHANSAKYDRYKSEFERERGGGGGGREREREGERKRERERERQTDRQTDGQREDNTLSLKAKDLSQVGFFTNLSLMTNTATLNTSNKNTNNCGKLKYILRTKQNKTNTV